MSGREEGRERVEGERRGGEGDGDKMGRNTRYIMYHTLHPQRRVTIHHHIQFYL